MDFGILQAPVYAGLTAASLMVMQVVLMFLVIGERGSSEVVIGDGGIDKLQQKIRVHANFVENVPTFLICLALVEIIGGDALWVIGLGVVFTLSRIAHAVGFSLTAGVSAGRLIGTLGTMLGMLATAGYLIYLIVQRL